MNPKLNQQHFIGEILIQQNGRKCAVYVCGEVVFAGGRVRAKQIAKERHDKTGLPVYNIKTTGNKILCYT